MRRPITYRHVLVNEAFAGLPVMVSSHQGHRTGPSSLRLWTVSVRRASSGTLVLVRECRSECNYRILY